MAFIIGVTGSIGSGKTHFASLFEQKGFYLVSSDAISKEILKTNVALKKALKEYFSTSIFDESEQVIPHKLGEIVFQNKKDLQFLSNLIHPLVREEIKKIINQKIQKSSIVIESALLFQGELADLCHLTITVYTKLLIALKRIEYRGTYLSTSTLKEMIKKQNKTNNFYEKSDIVVYNNSSLKRLEEKFNNLYSTMKDLKNELKQ
jgi:dephospho-CoA kinase